MTLVPVTPGGPAATPPVYAVEDIPQLEFEVILDAAIGQMDIDDYLTTRAQQISAQFSIWLYRIDPPLEASGDGRPGVLLVIEPDGRGNFSLGKEVYRPGTTYGWQAVALVRDQQGTSVRLWSPMLYFRTAPVATVVPELVSPTARDLALELISVCADQLRARDALATRLRGLHLYGNYPSASDTFFCTPLTAEESIPYLPVNTGEEAPLNLIISLGRLMADVDALKQREAVAIAPEDLRSLSTRVYDLISQVPELTVLPIGRRISTLAAVAEKLAQPLPEDPQGVTMLLNEMLLAIDSVVAGGTTELNAGYTQMFAVYAGGVDDEVNRLFELEPELTAILGTEEALYWLEYFADQQLQFFEMAEEVGRDRLSKALLMDQLRENRWAIIEPDADAFRYLEGAACQVDTDRIKRLTGADTAQVERLQAEIVRCHLLRLADYLWPEIR